ncbi:MAG TPA: DUF4402 domain-containing protein [Sphingomicrobium sp.]
MRHAHILGAALAALTAAAPANAATPAQQSNGRALILVPLTLTKVNDLSFGSVVPSAISGVVTINATTGARTFAGGVSGVPSDAGNRAYFAGAGSPSQVVIVTINPPAQLLNGAGDTIVVLGLTLDGPPIRTIDPVAPTFYVGVGGNILIAANQAEGLYTNTFDVTANYQ